MANYSFQVAARRLVKPQKLGEIGILSPKGPERQALGRLKLLPN